MNQGPLQGRVAIVTGGARGIGAAITKALTHDGARVVVIGLQADRDRTETLRASLNGTASLLYFQEGNVAQFATCQAMVERVLAEHGKIDILVNNAGITKDHTVRKMTVEEWQAVLDRAVSRTTATDGALRVEFDDPIHLSELARLVAAEQHCCAFFSFTITVDVRGIALEVRASDGASDIVAFLFGQPA